jgi:hypothetical protein
MVYVRTCARVPHRCGWPGPSAWTPHAPRLGNLALHQGRADLVLAGNLKVTVERLHTHTDAYTTSHKTGLIKHPSSKSSCSRPLCVSVSVHACRGPPPSMCACEVLWSSLSMYLKVSSDVAVHDAHAAALGKGHFFARKVHVHKLDRGAHVDRLGGAHCGPPQANAVSAPARPDPPFRTYIGRSRCWRRPGSRRAHRCRRRPNRPARSAAPPGCGAVPASCIQRP